MNYVKIQGLVVNADFNVSSTSYDGRTCLLTVRLNEDKQKTIDVACDEDTLHKTNPVGRTMVFEGYIPTVPVDGDCRMIATSALVVPSFVQKDGTVICSFCKKLSTRVRGVLLGPDNRVAICNECTDLCSNIFKEQP